MSLSRRVLRFFFRNPDRTAPDTLPDFPLRCQHCDELIRLAAVHPSERATLFPSISDPLHVFRDEAGHITCDLDHQILHRPMPSVL